MPYKSLACYLLLAAVGSLPALAAEDFRSSIKAGEQARQGGDHDAALKAFDAALALAANDTERGIALGKSAYVYASDLKEYETARDTADKALALEDTHPVARVTAMKVVAICQMRGEKDHAAAVKTLEKAMALEKVDWAKPTLALMLGDCYRATDQFPKAIETFALVFEMESAGASVKAVAYLNTGMTHQYNLRDAEQARAAYAKALELNPGLQEQVDKHLSNLPE